MSMLTAIDWGGLRTQSNTITYSFIMAAAGTWPQIGGGNVTPEDFTAFEKSAFRLAFSIIEKFIRVDLVELADSTDARFDLIRSPNMNTGLLGAMGPPQHNEEGIGWFNSIGVGWNVAGLMQGGQAFQTILHEVGHALGLAHPHDTGGGSTVYPGVTSDFFSYGVFDQNQGIYTMMSYNQGWLANPNARPDLAGLYGRSGTPMAYDVHVLQQKYGANTATARGNDTYTLPDVNASGTFWTCIWDTGGRDTIRYNGAKAAVIDLNMATVKMEAGGGGMLSYAKSIAGGFTIAKGVYIENAIGGRGADTLVGNALANTLTGGRGVDRLTGGLGGDTLYGGTQRDIFDFNNILESRMSASGRDKIMDFQPRVDDIDVSTIDANGSARGNGKFKFLADEGAVFTGVKGQLRWYHDDRPGTARDKTIVVGDINGDKRGDFSIELKGLKMLAAGDFIL